MRHVRIQHIQLRDSEKPGHYRLWVEHVEDGVSVSAEPICQCARGHKTPERARICPKAKHAIKQIRRDGEEEG